MYYRGKFLHDLVLIYVLNYPFVQQTPLDYIGSISHQGRREICFLTRKTKITTPSGAKIEHLYSSIVLSYLCSIVLSHLYSIYIYFEVLFSSVVAQAHCVCCIHLRHSHHFYRTCRKRGTDLNENLMLPAVLGVVKSLVSNPGVLSPVPTSVKLSQATLLAHKKRIQSEGVHSFLQYFCFLLRYCDSGEVT